MAKTNSRTSHLSGQTTSVAAATAQAAAETISDSYSTSVACTYAQSGSAATVGGTITVWARGAAGIWIALYEDYVFPLTDGLTSYVSFDIPEEYSEVAVEYTVPTGGTGTLNVDVLEVTGV